MNPGVILITPGISNPQISTVMSRDVSPMSIQQQDLTFNPISGRTDKFKTVPCKYFHSQQGCSKTENCTFIHDEKFAGQNIPSVNKYSSMNRVRNDYSEMSSSIVPPPTPNNYQANKNMYNPPQYMNPNPNTSNCLFI